MFVFLLTFSTSVGVVSNKDNEGNRWFEFATGPHNYSLENEMDLSYLNKKANQKIIIRNGHFYNSVTNERIRFFGTNTDTLDAFPEKESAPYIAKSIAQQGINVVRFTNMDNYLIWENNKNSKLSLTMLDKLHYFLYCLCENGIYANINLHVSRNYPEEEFQNKLIRSKFKYGKSLDRYYPPFIADQIKYADDLLGSYNQYTGYFLGEDPMILNIELNNENTMCNLDKQEYLDVIKGTIFETELCNQWRKWLKNKYMSFDDIYNSWILPFQMNLSENLADYNKMLFQKDVSGTEAEKTKNGDETIYFVNIFQKPKYSYGNQIIFPILNITKDTIYTLTFEAKAIPKDSNHNDIYANAILQENKKPYAKFSDSILIKLTQTFQKYEILIQVYPSVTTENPESTITLELILSPEIGEYTFRNIKLFKGRDYTNCDYYEGEKSIDNIKLPDENFSIFAHADFRNFIYYTELNTQKNITNFIKNKYPNIYICDSQASYGNILSYEKEYDISDFLDVHGYWQHPLFDDGLWSYVNFTIKNTPMFDSSTYGTFNTLTKLKPFNKLYTISEYNHPFPNEHMHEKFPMVGSWAAFHDWDIVYQFSYGQNNSNKYYNTGFFNMANNPIDISFAPFIALSFRSHYVSTSHNYVHTKISRDLIQSMNLYRTVNLKTLISTNPWWPGIHDVEIIDNYENEIVYDTNINLSENKKDFITEEITWKNSIYQVNAPKVRTITGRIGNNEKTYECNLGLLKINISLNQTLKESATIGILSLDDRDLENSKKILLSIGGKIMNTGQKWNPSRTSTGKTHEGANWGEAPVLVQFIDFDAIFMFNEKDKPTIWTLNELGVKNCSINVSGEQGNWKFSAEISKPSISFLIERNLPNDDNKNSSNKVVKIIVGIIVPIFIIASAIIIFYIIKQGKKSSTNKSSSSY